MKAWPISAEAARLHDGAIIWDNHACMPHRVESGWMEKLAGHREAGVTFVSLNLGDADVSFKTQCAMAAHFQNWIARNPDRYMLATSVDDVRRAKQSGKLAVAFDVEGAKALDGQISRVAAFQRIGVRWMAMVFNRANGVGGGVHDAIDEGLTAFGKQLVPALEDAGITICCTHTGYRTANDVLDIARGPVIFSHSNALAVHDHPRNIPDQLIKRCAESGGVVGINGLHIFLGGKDHLVDRFVNHIDHVVQLVGPQFVGIGLDYVFDQDDMNAQLAAARGTWPAGYGYEPGIRYLKPAELPQVTEGLLARGYSDVAVTAILGGNFTRVANETWK